MTERELAKNVARPVTVFRIRIKVVQEPRKRHGHRTNSLVTRKRPPENRRPLSSWLPALQGPDVLRLFALSTGSHVELDLLPFGERLVAATLDVRVVDENIVTLLAGDKTKAFIGVEKLHCSGSQLPLTFMCACTQFAWGRSPRLLVKTKNPGHPPPIVRRGEPKSVPATTKLHANPPDKIGRASCRERV